MTSRQPGTAPPRTTGTPGSDPIPDTGPRGVSGPWPLVPPVALLIILGMAGLRGTVTTPRWDGPLHRDGLAVGLALEVVFGILLVIAIRRRSGSQAGRTVNEVAAKLRAVLIFALSAGMVAVAVTVLVGLHLHLFTEAAAKPPRLRQKLAPKLPPRGSQYMVAFHVPAAALLYGLLILVLLAGVVLSVWWARRFRLPGGYRKDDGLLAEDPEELREAVESGRSALRALDDARAAIIACYVAMEASLAERGAARAAADTPDELLARAARTGLVRGTAAARLTALFYEARFSSHPLGRSQRDAAERALDELAAALAEPGPPVPAGPGEGQVSVDGQTRTLPQPFVVLATDNPIEYEGTYELPEAQLDRFLMRLRLGYLSAGDETDMLRRRVARTTEYAELNPVTSPDGVLAMRGSLEQVEITPDLLDYIVAIVTATRKDAQVQVGASPRGGLALVQLGRGQALLNQRDYVIPDDIKQVAVPALAHRVTLRPELWVRQVSADDVVAKLLEAVPTPKTDPGARAGGRGQTRAVTG